MSWLIVSIVAYFIAALNSVIDKFLLNRPIPHPVVYAFYVGLFSIFSVILTPFGFYWPGVEQVLSALGVGAIFLCALIAFFTALRVDEASRIVSLVGGFTPIFILILSAILFENVLTQPQLVALTLLIAGGVTVSVKRNQRCSIFAFHKYECMYSSAIAVLASLLFALFFVSAKFVFINQDFVSGFVWTRIGSFLAALLLLLVPFYRRLIFGVTKTVGKRDKGLFVINKTLAGVSFFLLNYAIALGNITLVNALEGIKYVFVFLLVILFSRKLPDVLSETTDFLSLLQKTTAIVLICVGIFILAFA